jgi:hypothetical protein
MGQKGGCEMKVKNCLAAMAGMLLCACAHYSPEQRLVGGWMFMPYDGSYDLTNVKDGDWVLKQRVIPPGAARIKDDFTHKDDVVPAGSILARSVRGDQKSVYCTLGPLHEKGEWARLLTDSRERHACLEDIDSNGTFDQYYLVDFIFNAVPVIDTELRDPKPTSITYETIDPRTMEKVYYAGIKYAGRDLFHKGWLFHFEYGSEDKFDHTTRNLVIKEKDDPHTLSVLGSSMTLLDKVEDDKGVDIHIARAIPPGAEFNLTQTVRYMLIHY